MKKAFKKIISLVLTIIMLMAVAAPATSAYAASDTVTIYIVGYGNAIYDENGTKVSSWMSDSMLDELKEVLNDLLLSLGKGMLLGDYDEYCDIIYNLIVPAFGKLKLDNNGESTYIDENGNKQYYYGRRTGENGSVIDPVTYVRTTDRGYSTTTYYFEYDWRLSVEYNAELLEQYINRNFPDKKINLVGRCLGGNIISAFLQNASDTTLARVEKAILNIASTEGADFIGALFSGEIYLDSDAVNNYVNYSLSENDLVGDAITPEVYEILTTIFDFINEAYALGFGLDVIQGIFEAVKNNVLARILRETYATFPSFWAMVADEYFDDAIDFVFNTDELKEEYAGLIEKAKSYNENVQVNARNRITYLSKNDIVDIMIVSQYNYANFPLSKDALKQSDSTALTSATSFGATTSNFGETLSKKYINSLSDDKYLSPDNMIDASTCVLPEKTWFMKNLYHGDFPVSEDVIFDKFLTSEDMTIYTYEEYPQYLNYDAETDTFSPVTGLDDSDIINRGTITSKLASLMKFLTLVMDFLKNFFSGNFSGLFGSKTTE